MSKIRLMIITPLTQYQADDGDLVTVTTKNGAEGFMQGHVPTIVPIIPGPLRYRIPADNAVDPDGAWRCFFTSVGYAEVTPTEVMIIVTAAEWAADMMSGSQKALERATARIKSCC